MNIQDIPVLTLGHVQAVLSNAESPEAESSVKEILEAAHKYGIEGYTVLLQLLLQSYYSRPDEFRASRSMLKLLSLFVGRILELPCLPSLLICYLQSMALMNSFMQLIDNLDLTSLQLVLLGLALISYQEPHMIEQGLKRIQTELQKSTQAPLQVPVDCVNLLLYRWRSAEDQEELGIEPFLRGLPEKSVVFLAPFLQRIDLSERLKRIAGLPFVDLSAVRDDFNYDIPLDNFMEECSGACTSSIQACMRMLNHFTALSDVDVCRAICLACRSVDYGGLSHLDLRVKWNPDVLLEALKKHSPHRLTSAVLQHLDNSRLLLTDKTEFETLLRLLSAFNSEPFPIPIVCGRVWKNTIGQLSFLKFAVAAPPEVFSFAHSPRIQPPVEGLHGHKSPIGTPNRAWLSLDLVEILCRLAEAGHLQSVESILQYPYSNCPEILTITLSKVKTEWNLVQSKLLPNLLPNFIATNPNSSVVLHPVWQANPKAVVESMLTIYSKDLSQIPRILDVCQDLKALTFVLEFTPISFSIDLAALASRREYLNLEKWIEDMVKNHGEAVILACMKYLKDRVLIPPGNVKLNAIIPSTDTMFMFFKSLHQTVVQMPNKTLLNELTNLWGAANRVHPQLHSLTPSTDFFFSNGVQQEVNLFFSGLFDGSLDVKDQVAKLIQARDSDIQREKEFFACTFHTLFHEIKFVNTYPVKDMTKSATLFGLMMKHRVFKSELVLNTALDYIVDCLSTPSGEDKTFQYGLIALEQFQERLVDFPSLCVRLLNIPHFCQAQPGIAQYMEKVLKGAVKPFDLQPPRKDPPAIQPLPAESPDVRTAPQDTPPDLTPAVPATAEEEEGKAAVEKEAAVDESQISSLADSLQTASIGGDTTPKSVSATPGATDVTPEKSSQPAAATTTPSRPESQQVQQLRANPIAGFGQPVSIEILMAAAEKRDGPSKEPSPDIVDKVKFIVNNVSLNNLEAKVKDLEEVLQEEHFAWFARYLVINRVSVEPNYLDLYVKMLDSLGSKSLFKEVQKATYDNCKVLLQSDLIKSSSDARSLLKNLGSWLGKLTIGRNQALRAKDIDPKSLIIDAYERGLLIAIVPFTTKILESCLASEAYRPPNPWTMGILSLLVEICNLPDIKSNLKFDIELLFKGISMELRSVRPSQLVENRARVVKDNPDFANIAAQNLQAEQSKLADHRKAAGAAAAAAAAAQQQKALMADIVVDPRLISLDNQLHLSRYLPAALEAAVQALFPGHIERCIQAALCTSKDLVMKDFAMEADESYILRAGSLAVSSLARSLAHVSFKEALRVTATVELHKLVGLARKDVDTAIAILVNDNIDLAYGYVEKTVETHATQDMKSVLVAALTERHKLREVNGVNNYDLSVLSQPNLANLAESLRPRRGKLTPAQRQVYEDFCDPWQKQGAQQGIAMEPKGTPDDASAPDSQLQFGGLEASVEPAQPKITHSLPFDFMAPSIPGGFDVAAPAPPLMKESNLVASLDRFFIDSANLKCQSHLAKVDAALSKPSLSPDSVEDYIKDLASGIVQSLGRHYENVALQFARKLSLRVLQVPLINLHFLAYMNILQVMKPVYPWLVSEVTAILASADEELQYLADIAVNLLLAGLVSAKDYSLHLKKLVDSRQNAKAIELSLQIVNKCLHPSHGMNTMDFHPILESLSMVSPRLAAHGSLYQIVDAFFQSHQKEKKSLMALTHGFREKYNPSNDKQYAPGYLEQVAKIFEDWLVVFDVSGMSDKTAAALFAHIQMRGKLYSEEDINLFSRGLIDLAVRYMGRGTPASNLADIDACVALILCIVKHYSDANVGMSKLSLISKALLNACHVLLADAELQKVNFNPHPYHRLFMSFLTRLSQEQSLHLEIAVIFSSALQKIQPSTVPAFSFSWLEIVSHKLFMPKLLVDNERKGWPFFHSLLLYVLKFMEPYLRSAELTDAVRLLYKGVLRIVLAILHDQPEFLCQYHFSFCDVIPPSCIQMRNVILSAFPRNMRLPDPFTSTLNVNIPDLSNSPEVSEDVIQAVRNFKLSADIEEYLRTRQPSHLLGLNLKQRLMLPPLEAAQRGTRFNAPLINSLVVFTGIQAIQQLRNQAANDFTADTPAMEIFKLLARELDTEGRYLFFTALANQLQYPNSHTHYFSYVFSTLFASSQDEFIKEQISRVLLERLVGKRPHPWGVVATFMWLVKYPPFNYWSLSFTQRNPEIRMLFDQLHTSCADHPTQGQPPSQGQVQNQSQGQSQGQT